ncbi:MAG: aldo/keto reductase, partial [Armatimonadetes bacterium]|nr:aldo/keto reductase [Armatimonadota bacterium]
YALEADTVARHIDDRQAAPPAMTWDDTLGNMKALDAWRAEIGLLYDMEKPAAQTLPVHKRPLSVRSDHAMQYGQVAGVEKPVARLVMGVDNQPNFPHAAVMFDDYFERGGNCFDTAYIYGGGMHERLLGQWIKSRGLRDRVVIIGKGVATPFNFPQHMRRQLSESLERMQTDFVDIYLAHRDNPEVPVGEWAEAFNELLHAGWIRSYGGSNWTLDRVQALNDYAQSKGLVGMAAVSNNFSLARMVDPVWSGCLAASDPDSRAWFARTQIPLFPWSSQARGFFTDRAHPADTSDAEMVRCWYSDDNFARQARAKELAEKKGVLPINIALAYVLHQPYPTFALFGPRTLTETRVSLQALKVDLTPDEVRWLNLEA